MKTTTTSLCAAVLLLMSTSCASIFGHSNYNVSINSLPSEAQLKITNSKGVEVFSGYTPATVRLKSSEGFFRKATYTLTFSKPGYDSYQTQINSSIQPWYFGNILVGGFLGMIIIDPLTGAMWQIDQEQVQVTLHATMATTSTKPLDAETLAFIDANKDKQGIQIYSLQDIPTGLRTSLIPLEKTIAK